MKRLLWVFVISFVAFAPYATADSILNINIIYVTGILNVGGGVGLTLIGPGTIITVSAGMGCHAWCDGFPIPDLSSVGCFPSFC